jgi:hypothetical protein
MKPDMHLQVEYSIRMFTGVYCMPTVLILHLHMYAVSTLCSEVVHDVVTLHMYTHDNQH